MRSPFIAKQYRHTAILWWTGAAAFLVASMGASHRPIFWVVAVLFALNGGLAMHSARPCKDTP